MAVTRREARLLAGTVSWLEAGVRSDQPTFVLLHGIPSSAELWRGVMDRLALAGRHAIAPDAPGYAPTMLPEAADHGIEGMVHVVLRLVTEQDLGKVWLVGHDLGAVATQLLATEHPDVVAGLTLSHSPIDAAWPPKSMRPVFTAASFGLQGLAAPVLAKLVTRMVPSGAKGTAAPKAWSTADAERVFSRDKLADREAKRAFARHVRAVAEKNNELTRRTWPKLPKLTVPTTLIWGTVDEALPWEGVGDRLRDQLPNPTVRMIQGAGHFLPGERPVEFAGALLEA